MPLVFFRSSRSSYVINEHIDGRASKGVFRTLFGIFFGGSIRVLGSHSPGGSTVTLSRKSSMPRKRRSHHLSFFTLHRFVAVSLSLSRSQCPLFFVFPAGCVWTTSPFSSHLQADHRDCALDRPRREKSSRREIESQSCGLGRFVPRRPSVWQSIGRFRGNVSARRTGQAG